MTPLQIKILLHYYYSPDDVSNIDFSAVSAEMRSFIMDGFMRVRFPDEHAEQKYTLTTLGHTFVETFLVVAGTIRKGMLE